MIEKYTIPPDRTVKDAIHLIECEHADCVFITDKSDILLGIFTHGDMRRFMLKGGNMSTPIADAMNHSPITFTSREDALRESKVGNLVVYPVISPSGRLVDVIFKRKDVINERSSTILKDIPLVIMAGGMGTRLYPYTKILPKALMPIGNLSITERIINNFTSWGCKEVFLILNHKAAMIRSYFEELEKDYRIHYIIEEKFLGTGGGLSLLKGMINSTFILSNCDILVNADFECLIKTHETEGNAITFVGAMKEFTIPYGVINTTPDGQIATIEEKPEISFLTNTGVYAIHPKIIDALSADEFIHITDIAKRYMELHEKVGVFPVPEKMWLDMGQFNEMETMLEELGIKDR